MPEARRSVTLILFGGVGLLALLLSYGAFIYTEVLWFDAVGYAAVFWKALGSRLAVGALGALAFGAILGVNLAVARGRHWPPAVATVLPGPGYQPISPRRANQILLGATVVLALVAGWYVSHAWLTVQLYLNQVPFGGDPEPVFGRDAGFYIFSLPFYTLVYEFFIAALLVSALGSGLVYAFNRQLAVDYGRIDLLPYARAHLSALAAAFFLLKVAGYRLQLFQLLYSGRGVTFGASYTDLFAARPALLALMVTAALLAAVMLANLFLRRLNLIIGSLVVLLGASVVLGTLWPLLMEQFIVEPDQLAKETPYIRHNIAFTNRAFGLDRIEEREFPAEDTLTLDDLQRNQGTLRNVRLWEERPLLQTYHQLQALRQYYEFAGVDFDRYHVNGGYRQVEVSARELNKELLPTGAQTWVNLKLIFTHGYGVVMSPSNEVTPEGLPVLFVRDIPPRSTVDLNVTQPRIYYGERTVDHVIVNTRREEFDYPAGDTNVYFSYDGRGGVVLSSPLVKGAFATRFRSYQMLINPDITRESRVMMYRHVVQRARHIAPFLRYDRDPYIVVGDDGRLFWILDAYTVSRGFPYSEPHREGMNYIRNSVKAVVDAFHGTVTFYLVQPDDPIAASLGRVFPGLFTPAEAMPDDVRRHIRYPQDLFKIQAQMYRKYHMHDPTVFYNSEDLWTIPPDLAPVPGADPLDVQDGRSLMRPYYLIMRLPGEPQEELMLILPYTPVRRDNMIAWLAARSDGPHYGQLLVFKMPKEKLVFGPVQVNSRIDQDPVISQNLTLWAQRGSNVVRGRVLIIPVENSILYVQPLYLQAEGTGLPEFRRAIVAYGQQIVMAETFEAALARIFRGPLVADGRPPADGLPVTGPEATLRELAERARNLYQEALDRARAGDWSGFGRALDDLGRVLEELQTRALGGS